MEKWPKTISDLTNEQKAIKHDWEIFWLEVLPKKYGPIEKFNHRFVTSDVQNSKTSDKIKTLEIGAGLGENIKYENLDRQDYYAIEIEEEVCAKLKGNFSKVHTIVADCQTNLPFENNYFDRVIATNVLEHLPNLPSALKEVQRVLKVGGQFNVVIPCEGGLAYSLGRKLTSERTFKKRYHVSYDWLIKNEHCNTAKEILYELKQYFIINNFQYFPLFIPNINCNLMVGLKLLPK